jgi:hypothetical protein
MRIFCNRLRDVSAIYALFGLLLIIFLIILIFSKNLDEHAGTAAWVQAVGSLLIILATVFISQREVVQAKIRDEKDKEEIRKSLAILARNCLEILDHVIQRLPMNPGSDPRSEFVLAYVQSDFELLLSGLADISFHQIGDSNLINAVLDLRLEVARIKWRLDMVNDSPIGHLSRRDLDSAIRTSLFNKAASTIRLVEGGGAESELTRRSGFVFDPTRDF